PRLLIRPELDLVGCQRGHSHAVAERVGHLVVNHAVVEQIAQHSGDAGYGECVAHARFASRRRKYSSSDIGARPAAIGARRAGGGATAVSSTRPIWMVVVGAVSSGDGAIASSPPLGGCWRAGRCGTTVRMGGGSTAGSIGAGGGSRETIRSTSSR